MLPNQVGLSKANNIFCENVDWIHTINALRLTHHKVSASISTSPSSIRTTKVILHTGSGYNIFRRAVLPLDWKLRVFPDLKIFSVEDVKKSFPEICQPSFYTYLLEVLSTGMSFWLLIFSM